MARSWEHRLENYFVFCEGADVFGDVKKNIQYSLGWVPSGTIVFDSYVYQNPVGEKIGRFDDLSTAQEAVEKECIKRSI